MSHSHEQDDVDERKAVLEFRRLLVSFFVSFSLLFVAVYATLQVFKPEVTAASAWFVHTLGGAGIGLGYFLPDAFTLPIPNDAFALVGRVGGRNHVLLSVCTTDPPRRGRHGHDGRDLA